MERFKNYLREQVVPTAQVSDGSIDIEKPAVRGQINATLQGVTAQPAVTPYVVLQRISKALAYFHIILPKRAYLEGDRGVEVIDVQQFGPRMGMTDQGEFIKEVPAKYFLFISYRTVESVGVTYAKPVVGGMFKVTAKLVDELELQKLMATAEIALAEDAACRQNMAKMMAPKEKQHTALGDCDCSQGDSPSTKSAVSVMMRRKDKKLSADSLDEEKQEHIYTHEKGPQYGTVIDHGGKFFTRRKVGMYWRTKSHNSKDAAIAHLENDKKKKLKEDALDEAMTRKQKDMAVRRFMSHDPEAGERILAMGKKDREEKKSFASAKKEIKRLKEEEQIDEISKQLVKSYQKKSEKSLKDAETLRTVKKRHTGLNLAHSKLTGDKYDTAPASGNYKSPKVMAKEETLDELKKSTLGSYIKKAHVSGLEAASKGEIAYARKDKEGLRAANKTGEKREQGIERAANKLSMKESRMPASVIKHKQKLASMSPDELKAKFAGKSEEHLKSMARRHGYGKDSDVYSKHVKEESLDEGKKRTILVTRKGDPHAKTGGGVIRIPKDKYDPKKYNLASE